MGLGDCLMAAGLAEELFIHDPSLGPVAICALGGKQRWNPVWERNPAIAVGGVQRSITCGGGALPYARRDGDRLIWSSTYRARDHRWHIYPSKQDHDAARSLAAQMPNGYVVIEPHGADRKNINRQWLLSNYQVVADQLRESGITVVQCGHDQSNLLDGVHVEPAETFHRACAIFQHARAVIAPEGGVPFGCVGIGQPNVIVLWGGCVSYEVLHFPEHTNIVDLDHTGCGLLTPCDDCADVWDRLIPDEVTGAVLERIGVLV